MWARHAALGALVLAWPFGCGNADLVGHTCYSDSNCGPGLVCEGATPSQTAERLPVRPTCPYTTCAPDGTCIPGFVCVATTSVSDAQNVDLCGYSVCIESCQTAGCPADWPCSASGVCELLTCDQPLAPTCISGYRCDPVAATATLAPFIGSSMLDTASPVLEARRGCVRKKCDEDGGFDCQPSYACQPDPAKVGESGCVSVPCGETGHCTDDKRYVCTPENDLPRPPGTDEHGCVVRNCSEGYLCGSDVPGAYRWSCAPEDPLADSAGCVVVTCTREPGLCGDDGACEPTAPNANLIGCRPLDCSEPSGPRCASGLVCDPQAIAADEDGCRATGSTPGTPEPARASGVCVRSP